MEKRSPLRITVAVFLSLMKAIWSGIYEVVWTIAGIFVIGVTLIYLKQDPFYFWNQLPQLKNLLAFAMDYWKFFFWCIVLYKFWLYMKDLD